MVFARIDRLREGYNDKYVTVESDLPELARFKGQTGRVTTVNCNGRALVTFESAKDRGRYDIELDYLKVVDKPEAKPARNGNGAAKPTPKAKPPEEEPSSPEKLSPLEEARLQKEAEKVIEEKANGKKDGKAVRADS